MIVDGNDYMALRERLYQRLRVQRALLLQQGELPSSSAACNFALGPELLHRLEEAETTGDGDRLVALTASARRVIGG
jgi:hypothetical protein